MFAYFVSVFLASIGVSYLSLAAITTSFDGDSLEVLAHLTISEPSSSIQSSVFFGLGLLMISIILIAIEARSTKIDPMKQFELDAIPAHSEINTKA